MSNHWEKNPGHWSRIEPPLRPDETVTRAIMQLAGGSKVRVLLLGVTSELANAFDSVQAIDKSAMMIAKVWPGDSATKRAQQGNWLELPVPEQLFDAAVGDGSFSNLDYPHEVRAVLRRVLHSLRPGGRFVFRMFERPDVPESRKALLATASGPAHINFHAFKWQLFMHLAGVTQATVPVEQLLVFFNELFPDRTALAARTGWPRELIDLVDVYRDSEVRFTFMTRSEFLAVLPPGIADLRFDICSDYDLTEWCPLASFTRP